MEYEKLKMWSYRIVHDKQFAPNPFKGVLTLATCKPLIRRSNESRPGVWIAGFAAYSVKYGVQPKKRARIIDISCKNIRSNDYARLLDKISTKKSSKMW